MSELPTKTSITPHQEVIAFVYQEPNKTDYRIKGIRIDDGSESLQTIARIIRVIRQKATVTFLNKKEIIDRFGAESDFIRPFTDAEKKIASGE